jgi:hypothetical protein
MNPSDPSGNLSPLQKMHIQGKKIKRMSLQHSKSMSKARTQQKLCINVQAQKQELLDMRTII